MEKKVKIRDASVTFSIWDLGGTLALSSLSLSKLALPAFLVLRCLCVGTRCLACVVLVCFVLKCAVEVLDVALCVRLLWPPFLPLSWLAFLPSVSCLSSSSWSHLWISTSSCGISRVSRVLASWAIETARLGGVVQLLVLSPSLLSSACSCSSQMLTAPLSLSNLSLSQCHLIFCYCMCVCWRACVSGLACSFSPSLQVNVSL